MAGDKTDEHAAMAALRATDKWLRVLIDELEIDPEATSFEFDAVNSTTGERRPLAASTLAERLASNADILEPGQSNRVNQVMEEKL